MAKLLILWIDDNYSMLQMYEAVLPNLFDCSITTTTNAYEGLRRAKELQPDLIMVDLMMSGMDGWELIQCLKQEDVTKKTPIGVLSALADDHSATRAIKLGAIEYIIKPAPPGKIVDFFNNVRLGVYEED